MRQDEVIYRDVKDAEEYLSRYLTLMADETNRLRLEAVLKSVPRLTAPGARVLDLACGGGAYLRALRERFGLRPSQACVLDIEMACVRGCQINNWGVLPSIGDAGNLPFSDESFDLVLGLDIIEHLADDRRFAKEVARVLAPGGYVVLSTQNSLSPQFLVGWIASAVRRQRWTGWDPNHLRFYTRLSIARLIKDAGLAPVTFGGTYYVPFHFLSRLVGAAFDAIGQTRTGQIIERKVRAALYEVNGVFEAQSSHFPWSGLGWGLVAVACKVRS